MISADMAKKTANTIQLPTLRRTATAARQGRNFAPNSATQPAALANRCIVFLERLKPITAIVMTSDAGMGAST